MTDTVIDWDTAEDIMTDFCQNTAVILLEYATITASIKSLSMADTIVQQILL